EMHTPQHHRVYVTRDMAMRSRKEWRLVLIPPYGILLILLGVGPGIWAFHLGGHDNLAALFAITCMLYVMGYEWLHLSYHLGADTWIGRRTIIGLLRRHHATHHDPRLMQRWNFNVVVPFWDWVRGTIHREAADAARETQKA